MPLRWDREFAPAQKADREFPDRLSERRFVALERPIGSRDLLFRGPQAI
jgi:hypothetical protein